MNEADELHALRERMTRMESWMMEHEVNGCQYARHNNEEHRLILDRLAHLSEAILSVQGDFTGYKRAIYAVGFLIGGIVGVIIKYGASIFHFIKVKF